MATPPPRPPPVHDGEKPDIFGAAIHMFWHKFDRKSQNVCFWGVNNVSARSRGTAPCPTSVRGSGSRGQGPVPAVRTVRRRSLGPGDQGQSRAAPSPAPGVSRSSLPPASPPPPRLPRPDRRAPRFSRGARDSGWAQCTRPRHQNSVCRSPIREALATVLRGPCAAPLAAAVNVCRQRSGPCLVPLRLPAPRLHRGTLRCARGGRAAAAPDNCAAAVYCRGFPSSSSVGSAFLPQCAARLRHRPYLRQLQGPPRPSLVPSWAPAQAPPHTPRQCAFGQKGKLRRQGGQCGTAWALRAPLLRDPTSRGPILVGTRPQRGGGCPPPPSTDPKIVARNNVLCRRRRRRRFCFSHTAGGNFFVRPHVSILKILRILWRIQKWLKSTKRLCSHLAHFWATSDSAPRSEAEGLPETAGVM